MARSYARSRAAPAPHSFSLSARPALRLNMPPAQALRYINGLPTPEEQINYHITNAGLYARDGRYGDVYCCAEVDAATFNDFRRHRISRAQFLHALRVKLGVTTNLPRRRRQYRRCERTGLIHLWFFAFRTRNRYRLEHLSHLRFKCYSPADRCLCSSCGITHCEYWRFADVGCSFNVLVAQFRAFAVAIGEPGVRMRRLTNYCIAFPQDRS
ncbi:hypothetical protein B0H16DRAFT_1758021 [Mycena metata]|uniref:Bacteriophage T5 Orf172 DNA-binding domain-containing protein n=1 Tax=Mycena metata TaxID=1033252 RepID=A0AAD7IES2_9AGAR|nr:hypothetical protein B0H16DRAFT_1758021 [Mycena metata]